MRPSPAVVILAAGRGSRMRAERPGARLDGRQRDMADRGLKALIPFGGEPYLSYGLSHIADAGFREVCLVVGPGDDPIRRMYETIETGRLALSFAVQQRPDGGARALLAAERFMGGGPIVVLNADDLYPAGVLARLRDLEGSGLVGFHADALVERGNVARDRIAEFAALTVDQDGFLDEIVEKPRPPDLRRMAARPNAAPCGGSNDVAQRVWVSMTCWRFRSVIFEACRAIAPSLRGEYELPDAVRFARRELGERFRVLPSHEGVLDLSRREDVAGVEARLRGRTVRL